MVQKKVNFSLILKEQNELLMIWISRQWAEISEPETLERIDGCTSGGFLGKVERQVDNYRAFQGFRTHWNWRNSHCLQANDKSVLKFTSHVRKYLALRPRDSARFNIHEREKKGGRRERDKMREIKRSRKIKERRRLAPLDIPARRDNRDKKDEKDVNKKEKKGGKKK